MWVHVGPIFTGTLKFLWVATAQQSDNSAYTWWVDRRRCPGDYYGGYWLALAWVVRIHL
jgi:hypothetical protein